MVRGRGRNNSGNQRRPQQPGHQRRTSGGASAREGPAQASGFRLRATGYWLQAASALDPSEKPEAQACSL